MTSQWRRSREAAEYREITEDLNDAMYALVIIRARNEQLIQTHTKDEIRTNLKKGIKTIDNLLEAHTDQFRGSLIEQTILKESDISLEDLHETRDILTALKQDPYISSQPSLDNSSGELERVAEDTLEELDDTAYTEFNGKYGYNERLRS